MENRITTALINLFEKHRIVFWYDEKKEFRKDFDELVLPEIEKLEINNNEYNIKYRILRERPNQKFLLYHEGKQPPVAENWLADVKFAQGEFRTEQSAIWLADLGLSLEFLDLVQSHADFFNVEKRRVELKKLLKSDDTSQKIRLKMVAVCSGSEARVDSVLENLLQELADKKDAKFNLLEQCNLLDFLWEQLKRCYGYHSTEPSIKDFAITLFKSCYAIGTNGVAQLNSDALVFLKRWKDSRQFESCFEIIAHECAEILSIKQDLETRDFRTLMDIDYFRLIDQKIISELVRAITQCSITCDDVALWVRKRRQSHWIGEFSHLYEAIDYAAQFVHTVNSTKLNMNTLIDGIQNYTRIWFKIDQYYRKFIYHVQMSSQISLMAALIEQIENLYSNTYLLKLGDRFQSCVNNMSLWTETKCKRQNEFFSTWVNPFLEKNNKVCVIISDALRYEIGDELLSVIQQEDRYSVELTPMISMLPSYTQLGMAALLPHDKLEFANNETATVIVDGQNSQGTENRRKILDQATNHRATACRADELKAMRGDDCRTLMRNHDVIYVYHNRIDNTGDKRDSEERVFEAVEETISELVLLLKKLTSANANNVIITSDHGFIYQNRAIDESDFSGSEPKGKSILFKDRRFIIGHGLEESPYLNKFTSMQLGLGGDVEVQIPKSINRLRLKGSGSRFVHGGASLQEITIPVLKINKKRQSDITSVEVDILRGVSSVITSGQLSVTLYQLCPVSDKVQPRTLRLGIYTEAGELISDCHEMIFDLNSDNPRSREMQIRFVLSRKADSVNGQEVILRLEEKQNGTTHYKEYKSVRYLIRRSFTSDFDF